MSRAAFAFLMAFTPLVVQAGDAFQSGLHQLQQTQKRIDQRMARLGFSISTDSTHASSSDSQPESKLFQVHDSLSSVHVPVGKLVFGKTLNRLVVGPESSPILIELNDQQGVLSDVRLLGKAHPASTEGRVALELEKILFKTGRSIAIQAIGLDESGALGLSAQVFSRKAWALAGSVATGFVSGLAASQETLSQNAFGFAQPQTTGRNAVLQGVAQVAADQSKRLIDESTKEKPVLVIEAETPVTVLFNEEVRL